MPSRVPSRRRRAAAAARIDVELRCNSARRELFDARTPTRIGGAAASDVWARAGLSRSAGSDSRARKSAPTEEDSSERSDESFSAPRQATRGCEEACPDLRDDQQGKEGGTDRPGPRRRAERTGQPSVRLWNPPSNPTRAETSRTRSPRPNRPATLGRGNARATRPVTRASRRPDKIWPNSGPPWKTRAASGSIPKRNRARTTTGPPYSEC